jgi:hypothetical protein
MTTAYNFNMPVTGNITLHAKWTFRVSGHVYLDFPGDPAAGAEVKLILPNWDNLSLPYEMEVTQYTDSSGSYSFSDTILETGKGYVIIASFAGYTSRPGPVNDELIIDITLLSPGPGAKSLSLSLEQLLLQLKK